MGEAAQAVHLEACGLRRSRECRLINIIAAGLCPNPRGELVRYGFECLLIDVSSRISSSIPKTPY